MTTRPVPAGLAAGRKGPILFSRPTSGLETLRTVSGGERRAGSLPMHPGHRQGKKFGKALPRP